MKPRNFFNDAFKDPGFMEEMDTRLQALIPNDIKQRLDEDQWKILLGDFMIFSVTELEGDLDEKIMKRAQELSTNLENNQ